MTAPTVCTVVCCFGTPPTTDSASVSWAIQCVDAVLTTFLPVMETSENAGHQLHMTWLIAWELTSLCGIGLTWWRFILWSSGLWRSGVSSMVTSCLGGMYNASVFYPEEGDSKFVQHVGIHLSDCMMMSEGHSMNTVVVSWSSLFGNIDCNCEISKTWLQIKLKFC